MFALITTIVIFLAAFILITYFMYEDCFDLVPAIAFGFVLSMLITMLISIFIWVPFTNIDPGDANTKIVETNEPVAVVALKDNLSLEGSMSGSFYRVGYVDEELYYYYFYEDGEVLRQGKIPAEQTSIVFGDEPCIVEQHWEVSKGFYWNLDAGSTYILTVPAGSITEDITLDLE